MNKEVNFEIAKALKLKRFDVPTELGYNNKGKFYQDENYRVDYNKHPYSHLVCSAPTIADVVMWLYEKHKIWIHCEICFDGNSFIPKITKVVENLYPFDTQFNSPTEAYEAAITHALETHVRIF